MNHRLSILSSRVLSRSTATRHCLLLPGNLSSSTIRRQSSSLIRFTPGSPATDDKISKDANPNQPLIYDITRENHLENPPLVCLLGWLGADWKHVDKYMKWYSQCNMNCLAIIPPMHSILSDKASKNIADRYIAHLDDLKHVDKSNLVFHVLSGNGLNMYGHLIQSEYFVEHKNDVRALIADSTPPIITVERFSKGFVGAIRTLVGHSPHEDPEFFKHWLFTPIVESFFRLYLERLGHRQTIEKFRENVIKMQPSCNQLFIYSDGDTLIPPEDIEYFMQLQDAILTKYNLPHPHVHKLKLTDSEHVAHFKTQPYLYSSEVLKFLSDSLKSQDPRHQ